MPRILRWAKSAWRKIHLVDRCLMIIMAILLMQSALSLFDTKQDTQEVHNIDIIVRTSAAAIFGYFISANFIKECKGPTPRSAPDAPPQIPQASAQEQTESTCGHIQIIIISIIGIVSLFILLIYRNFCVISPVAMGTLSQLRDFVSGCVGFLIGCETNGKQNDAPKQTDKKA